MTLPSQLLPGVPQQVGEATDEPPGDQTGQVYAALRVGLDALRNVAHEAIPPAAPVLEAQRLHLAAMLVKDQKAWLVNEGVPGPDDPIEHVEVATAGKRGASVQRLVEAP
jgi:hypothetical protein